MDIKKIDDLKQYLEYIPGGTTLGRYLEWLGEQFQNKDELYKKDYEQIVKEEEPFRGEGRPFLSVITRTQGKRAEMLRETFLCLLGQEDQDFEVVLIGHKLNDEQSELVNELLDELPEWFREKIRFFKLDYGTRTTPLNLGFAHARGEYIVALDDDDIVMDHWVSSFHEAALKNPGVMLHVGVLMQDWVTVGTESGIDGLRAANAPEYVYTEKFDFFRQIQDNRCPIMSIAFPEYLFHRLGMIFDETLTTAEDWDYLMRCAFIAGVYDIEDATSIYRIWKNAEASKTVHNKNEWYENRIRIKTRFNNMPIIVPAEVDKVLPEEPTGAGQEDILPGSPNIQFSALYLDRGDQFNQDDLVMSRFLYNGREFDSVFYIPNEPERPVRAIRFDPGEGGLLAVKHVVVMLEYEDGERETRTLAGTVTNGMMGNDDILFIKNDPWIIWNDIRRPLKKVRVIGEASTEITDDMLMGYLSHMAENMGSGLSSKIHSVIGRIKGR